jgi:cytochrome c oxidase subunit 3/cytochrome o ubiquinol oxidase subunit 3
MSEFAAESLITESPRAALAGEPVTQVPSLTKGQWGMLSFLASEVAFFSTLIVTYITSVTASGPEPTPAILSLPLVIGTTACLLSSSLTIHLAERRLRQGQPTRFKQWWGATIALGIAFLAGTAVELRGLIVEHGLTPSVNLFGSSYYTLVGFHAAHVTIGVIIMAAILWVQSSRTLPRPKEATVGLVAWYWHFVDAVWIVVFSVVYLVCR